MLCGAKHSTVRWLDGDPGQGEFAPPGVVSLDSLAAPLLGNASTHRRRALFEHAYFLGDVEPGREPTALQMQMHALFQAHYTHAVAAPLVANSCGWTKGMGLNVLQSMASAMQGANCALVHVSAFTPEEDALKGESALVHEVLGAVAKRNALRCFVLPSAAKGLAVEAAATAATAAASERSVCAAHRMFERSAAARRNWRLVRHLCGGAAPDLMHQVPLRRVPFRAVRLSVRDIVPQEALVALNGAVVGLCADAQAYAAPRADYAVHVLAAPPWLAPCAALGLVRCIDPDARYLYVHSALDADTLRHVNTLVLGSVTLPVEVLTTASMLHDSLAQAPYVVFTALGAQHAGSVSFEAQRSNVPRKRLRRQ